MGGGAPIWVFWVFSSDQNIVRCVYHLHQLLSEREDKHRTAREDVFVCFVLFVCLFVFCFLFCLFVFVFMRLFPRVVGKNSNTPAGTLYLIGFLCFHMKFPIKNNRKLFITKLYKTSILLQNDISRNCVA